MTSSQAPRTVVFALGANVGRPMEALRRAARAIAAVLEGPRVSAVYETPPEGGAAQPDYLNAVVAGDGWLTPEEALALSRTLEADAGRRRPHPGAPRSLDVDVIFVGDAVLRLPHLTVPHPRWRLRDFVVVPLLDVAPDFADPESGMCARDVARAHGWTSARFTVAAGPGELLAVEAT